MNTVPDCGGAERKTAERRTEKILTQLGVGVILVDADLRIVGHGAEQEVTTSQPADDRCSRPVVDLFPELIGCEGELLAVTKGRCAAFELPMINRLDENDAGRHYLSLTALPDPEAPGHLVLVVRDVTSEGRMGQQIMQHLNEVRLLRAQLETANARLVRLDAEKSGLLRMAAHDLRAPLTVIKGYVQMVMDDVRAPLSEDAAESLGVVLGRTEQMARLIDNLLDVERIEAGQVWLQRQPVDLSALVEEVGRGFWPAARQKGVTLTWNAPAGLVHPSADRERLNQALSNLVSNAAKFTPDGGRVTIHASQQGNNAVVEVSDTGPGLCEADLERVFQRFFRSDEARRQRIAGTGLGLPIAKAIVERHGGQVFCRSQLGQGSTFGFSLPIEGG